MKITIVNYSAVAQWRWKGIDRDDSCGICQNAYDATCSTCRIPGDGCPILWGRCSHKFHKHCIEGWLTSLKVPSAQKTCPMCRAPWAVDDNAPSNPVVKSPRQGGAIPMTPDRQAVEAPQS